MKNVIGILMLGFLFFTIKNGMPGMFSKVVVIRPEDVKGSMDDLIGMDDIKQEMSHLSEMIRNRKAYASHNIDKPFNAMMTGPAGTGKNQPSEHLVTTFAIRIQPNVQREIAAAAAAEARGHFCTSFEHLERAHVLGQAATAEHVRVHGHMLRFALRNSLHREAFGQLWRLVAACIFTAPGLVPEGNTGGSDVSSFRCMPIPKDLQ